MTQTAELTTQTTKTTLEQAMSHLMTAFNAAQTALEETQSAYSRFREGTATSTTYETASKLNTQGRTEFEALLEQAGMLITTFNLPMLKKMVRLKQKEQIQKNQLFAIEPDQMNELSNLIDQLTNLPTEVESAQKATQLGIQAQSLLMTISGLIRSDGE